jgi:hypothetical protein
MWLLGLGNLIGGGSRARGGTRLRATPNSVDFMRSMGLTGLEGSLNSSTRDREVADAALPLFFDKSAVGMPRGCFAHVGRSRPAGMRVIATIWWRDEHPS